MPVAPISYEAQVSAALVAMIAASASWQAACGVATATLARACIIEDDAGLRRASLNVDGTALDTARIWAAVRVGTAKTTLRAWQTYGRSGEAQILIVAPKIPGDTPADAERRARNLAGAIRDDINAQWGQVVGGTPTPAAGDCDVAAPVLADDTGPLAGSILIHLDISWRDIP